MSSSFNIGDLVWVKRDSFQGFPSWPSVITKDKKTGEHERRVENIYSFHVTMLGTDKSSWISNNLIPFSLNDCGPNGTTEVVPKSKEYERNRAVAQANQILQRKAVIEPTESDHRNPPRPNKRNRLDQQSEEQEGTVEQLPMPRVISQRQVVHSTPTQNSDEAEMLSCDDYNDEEEGDLNREGIERDAISHPGDSDTGLNDTGHVENNVLVRALVFDPHNIKQRGHVLCNYTTINDLVLKITKHSKTCTGAEVIPVKNKVLPKGHIGYAANIHYYQCLACRCTFEFCPSPIVEETGRPIADYLVMHSKITSSGLDEDIERFTEELGFSSDFEESFEANDFNLNLYCDIVHEMAASSMREARREVIVEEDQIDGTFDATHLIRKNSPCSAVSMLSPDTLKVTYSATINRTDDPIAQRHETVGTRMICQEVKDDGLRIRIGSSDGGNQVGAVLEDEFPETYLGTRDLFHGLKNDSSNVHKCTHGPDKAHEVSWHHQLFDKGGPLLTHIRYAVTNSSISAEEFRDPIRREEAVKVLKSRILNPLQHYQDRHQKCSPLSRCNADPGYKLSRAKVTDPKALKIMEATLTSTSIFQNAEKYLLNTPTSMNESYHNRMQKYFSKRTYLSARKYSLAVSLSILDHNENTEGIFRNGKRIEPLPLGENGLPKQPIQSRTFVYNIWKCYMLRRMIN